MRNGLEYRDERIHAPHPCGAPYGHPLRYCAFAPSLVLGVEPSSKVQTLFAPLIKKGHHEGDPF